MTREFTKNRLSPGSVVAGAPAGAPALARLARILARQAAREQLTPHTEVTSLITQTELRDK
jgi:hypothetical protein